MAHAHRISSSHGDYPLHDGVFPSAIIRADSPLIFTNAFGMENAVKPQGWEPAYFSIPYQEIAQVKCTSQHESLNF